ncbi:MAG TPA: Maf family protein [Anaerolineales bacterium]|nr:Maf family protein [Anaerolineales bacterium]
MNNLKIILASTSPRRKELLGLITDHFEIESADVNESVHLNEMPWNYVRRLALEKALKVAKRHGEDVIVLGSDTTVVLDDEIIGKPIDSQDAWRILSSLKGRYHQVYTGVAAVNNATTSVTSRVIRTDVPMRAYSNEELNAYIASGDPMDKAGAYGIQNSDFVAKQELVGCYASVMGFPICAVQSIVQAAGLPTSSGIEARCQELIRYQCSVFSEFLIQ